MIDTIETLKAAAAELTVRVAAFEKAQKRVEEEEPPKLTAAQMMNIVTQCSFWLSLDTGNDVRSLVARLRWCERELARLRDGLSWRPGDMMNAVLPSWVMAGAISCDDLEAIRRMAREIQRHRALLRNGGGK